MSTNASAIKILSGLQDPAVSSKKKGLSSLNTCNNGLIDANELRDFIQNINEHIKTYNTAHEDFKKLNVHTKIHKNILTHNNNHSANQLLASPSYLAMINDLSKDLLNEKEALYQTIIFDKREHLCSLSFLIAHMQVKSASLLSLLLNNNNHITLMNNLKTLYQPDDKSYEARRFRIFMKNHRISYLGGDNSKNFKVTHLISKQSQVLKLENRINMPRHTEEKLREKLPSHLTEVFTERMVIFLSSSNTSKKVRRPVVRTLLVTRFCEKGSIGDYRKKLKSVPDILNTAELIFSQMARIFLELQSNHFMFPDAKMSNWLLNSKGILQIADLKSLIFTTTEGVYKKGLPENRSAYFLSSSHYNAPECLHPENLKSDGIHAYLLGNNLYQFITGKKFNRIDSQLSKALLKTKRGKNFQSLINELLEPNNHDRLSVKDAVCRLNNFQSFPQTHPAYTF